MAQSRQQSSLGVVGPVTVGPLEVKQGSNAGNAIMFHEPYAYGTCLE